MAPELTWYVLRATGIVAWLLLTGSIAIGLALRTKLFGRAARPPWLLDLHRGVSGTAVGFTLLHVAAVLVDPWIDLTWLHVLVPFTAPWRPWAVGNGVVGLHLLLAIQLSSLARRRVGPTWWRRIHLAAAPAWVVSTVHLLTAGTDVTNVLLGTAVLAGLTLVTFGWGVRLLQPRRRRSAEASAARGAS